MAVRTGDEIVVIKQNISGEETWRYSGVVTEINQKTITLEAFFNRDDMPFHGIMLCRGDRFIETYFSDRWYNIFEIFDHQANRQKGWYCNITRPAVFTDGMISYVDLALDLLVFPDFTQLVLDEDEFDLLAISEMEKAQARLALHELQQRFALKSASPTSGQ